MNAVRLLGFTAMVAPPGPMESPTIDSIRFPFSS